jgi:hypothetical protein
MTKEIREVKIATEEMWLNPVNLVIHDSCFWLRLRALPKDKQREYMDSIGAIIKAGEKYLFTTYYITDTAMVQVMSKIHTVLSNTLISK